MKPLHLNKKVWRNSGFLLLEMLISALILAGAVATSMYLFRMGFQYLEKVNLNNKLSAKIPQAISYLIKEAPLERKEGTLSLGDEVILTWKAERLEKVQPQIPAEEGIVSSPLELYLYRVNFTLSLSNYSRDYKLYVFRYKTPKRFEEFF